QAVLANQPELFSESRVGVRALLRRVAVGELTTAALRQPRVGRMSGGDRWLGQAVAEIFGEVERARLGDAQRVCDCIWELQEAADLQVWCPWVELTIGASQLVALLERRAILDRHERVLQPVARLVVIVDVPGGDDLDTHLPGQSSQCPIPGSVAVDEVVLEFHEYAFSPKPVDPAPESHLGLRNPASRSQRGHLPLTAAHQADQAGAVPGQPGHRQAGVSAPAFALVLLAEIQPVRQADQAAEVAVPPPVCRQEREVVTLTKTVLVVRQCQLDARDRLDGGFLAEAGGDAWRRGVGVGVYGRSTGAS